MKRNSGMGFLMFSDKKVVKDFLYNSKNFFSEFISDELS